MRNRPVLQMLVIGAIGIAILIPISLFLVPWFPAEGSTQAHNIHTLYDVLLIATIPIFVGVETVVAYSMWKFRMKPGEEDKDGPPIHGNARLEVVWTVVPALLLLSLATYSYTVLHSDEKAQRGEMVVNVTARQFAFEFSYPRPSGGQVVSPVLYLPKGRPVVFHLRSLDVVHSFFVPQFSVKLDAVPGITTTLRATPDRIGTYPAECTELCGAGHSLMRATVHVVSKAAFATWLGSQKLNGSPPIGNPPRSAVQPGVPGDKTPVPNPPSPRI
ncbi:MAG: cytochrome c oxidase subunit II [Solirubrobacteraceae bacterium]